VCAAEPLIFAPPHPSRAKRGEGMQFELFLKYTANLRFFIGVTRLTASELQPEC
jgi:hypothetical protein